MDGVEATDATDATDAIDSEVFNETWAAFAKNSRFDFYLSEDGDVSLDALVRDVTGQYLTTLKEAMNAPGSGKSKGGWATNATRKQLQTVTDRDKFTGNEHAKSVFAGGEYTAHHKVSQSDLSKLAAKARSDGMEQEMLHAVGATGDNLLKALLNFPGNLEAGPRSERRVGDPGSVFDPNLDDGEMTPRSELLGDVASEISREKINWKTVITRLQEVKSIQDRHHDGVISPPKLDQWKLKGEKYARE